MITYQVESFERALPELRVIFPTHWRELALFQDRMPLAPNFGDYITRERNGSLFLTTCRLNGHIVAYYVAFLSMGLHYSATVEARLDMVYVIPEVRNRGFVVRLFERVEAELRRRGAMIWYTGYKAHNPLGMPKLLDHLGFTEADIYRAKWIGD
jgi:GNAT superfamily N-acetyltransferase